MQFPSTTSSFMLLLRCSTTTTIYSMPLVLQHHGAESKGSIFSFAQTINPARSCCDWASINSYTYHSTVQKNSNDPPLENIQQTRTIKGYLFNENLRPNQQLDVHALMGFLQNLLKTFIFRGFSCHLPNWMKNFTLSRLFFLPLFGL